MEKTFAEALTSDQISILELALTNELSRTTDRRTLVEQEDSKLGLTGTETECLTRFYKARVELIQGMLHQLAKYVDGGG